ncbi:MAG TPA: hypothetical protein VNJ08_10020 [Bacteriovoracaceae bacterium]|nr:hypothetical protein [Bacteriovoracaceae bacterium]
MNMEQLKVKKKDIIIGNAVIYLILSFLFLYLQYAYRHHLSPFSLLYFRKSAELFWYIALPIVVSIMLIWRHHWLSLVAFSISTLLVGFKVVEGLFIEFNKIIVIALFFYSVISYFLYQLLADYLSKASINPNYAPSDLFEPLLQKISCTLQINEETHVAFLTNWDEEGCFVKTSAPMQLPAKIQVTVQFHGREFIQVGEVVAQSVDLTGIGIKFSETPKDLKIFNWAEFMEIVQELGFQPERLR